MKRTKMGFALAALATTMLTASLAMARPAGPAGGPGGPGGPGAGYGPCGGAAYAQLAPEKQAALQKLQEAYFAKTAQLRADIGVKRAELNALTVSGNPDTAKVQALSKDMGDLVGKLTAERALFRAQVTKEFGPAGLAACRGFGGGFGRGHGHGFGPGHMGGGYGMMGY